MAHQSVYSIGLVGGIGTAFSGLARGELAELTKLHLPRPGRTASELVPARSTGSGAGAVVGKQADDPGAHRQGMIELMATGTALRRLRGDRAGVAELIPQVRVTRGRRVAGRSEEEPRRALREVRLGDRWERPGAAAREPARLLVRRRRARRGVRHGRAARDHLDDHRNCRGRARARRRPSRWQ